MPIYEYVCEACGRLTEVMHKVSDPSPTDCPECGERKLARIVSRTSFQLKGGGWYSDLYASPKKKPEPSGGGAESGSGGSGEPAKAKAEKPSGGAAGGGGAKGSA